MCWRGESALRAMELAKCDIGRQLWKYVCIYEHNFFYNGDNVNCVDIYDENPISFCDVKRYLILAMLLR